MLTLILLAHIFEIRSTTQSAVTPSLGIKHLIIWFTTASARMKYRQRHYEAILSWKLEKAPE
jgi:hypothetical protein